MCTTRPHCANIAMIVAGTSAQTRKLHVNQTRVQMSSRNPVGMVFLSRNYTVRHVTVFNTRTMTNSVRESHVGGSQYANHHVSTKASLILIVWSSSQKTHSTNVAMTIRETLSQTRTLNKFHMRTDTSGQYTFDCHSARCVYPWTTQCNICRDNR